MGTERELQVTRGTNEAEDSQRKDKGFKKDILKAKKEEKKNEKSKESTRYSSACESAKWEVWDHFKNKAFDGKSIDNASRPQRRTRQKAKEKVSSLTA